MDSRELVVGPHLPYGKGLLSMVETAVELEANTFQFYTRNLRAAQVKPPDREEVERARRLWEEKDFFPPVAHAPYSLNPASQYVETRDLAVRVLIEDLARVDLIGCSYLVVHPGHALDESVGEAIKNLTASLNRVFDESSERGTILLETMSGTGAEIGYALEQLAAVFEGVDRPGRLGLCLDTGHLYASGQLLLERPDRLTGRIDELFGRDAVRLCHLNDSAHPEGSRQDRHAKFGMGQIALTGFLDIFRSGLLKNLPLILESPCERVGHFEGEIKSVRQLTKVAKG